MPVVEIKVKGFQCERCSHQWIARIKTEPRVCPKCKSPYWNMKRRAERKAQKWYEKEKERTTDLKAD